MTDHIASRFDRNINTLVSRVMALGGLVEAQTRHAVEALLAADAEAARAVVQAEMTVDQMEMDIDRDLSSAFGRRQPKAAELRLLTALSRVTSNLERVGDEAERIARAAQGLAAHAGVEARMAPGELQAAATLAGSQLRHALDAFARLDTVAALAVFEEDRALDREFGRFLSSTALRMARQPRSVASGVALVLAGKSLERIGDHARNIAECVIYIVQGEDVRHARVGAALGVRPA